MINYQKYMHATEVAVTAVIARIYIAVRRSGIVPWQLRRYTHSIMME